MQFKNSTTKFYLTKKQKQQAQKAFKIFDQDGSGQISIRQFDQILKSIGQNLSQQQLQQIIQSIDKDGNGFIDFQQFLELVSPKMIMNRSDKSYVQAFKIIDDNQDGVLDKQQLKRANLITGFLLIIIQAHSQLIKISMLSLNMYKLNSMESSPSIKYLKCYLENLSIIISTDLIFFYTFY